MEDHFYFDLVLRKKRSVLRKSLSWGSVLTRDKSESFQAVSQLMWWCISLETYTAAAAQLYFTLQLQISGCLSLPDLTQEFGYTTFSDYISIDYSPKFLLCLKGLFWSAMFCADIQSRRRWWIKKMNEETKGISQVMLVVVVGEARKGWLSLECCYGLSLLSFLSDKAKEKWRERSCFVLLSLSMFTRKTRKRKTSLSASAPTASCVEWGGERRGEERKEERQMEKQAPSRCRNGRPSSIWFCESQTTPVSPSLLLRIKVYTLFSLDFSLHWTLKPVFFKTEPASIREQKREDRERERK